MAFDGFVTYRMVSELKDKLISGKIDKIYQPEKDELVIFIRTLSGQFRLLISATSSNPRIHLTEMTRENPITAPLFCMILRKHLVGGRIKNISQHGFDRTIRIDIECYTEMGDLTEKSLIVEIMGKHSNIILVQKDNKIIDSIKHIDFTVSAVRQILPNLIYELPPSQNKLNPLETNEKSLKDILGSVQSDAALEKVLLSSFTGMSPLMAREIVFCFCGMSGITAGEINTLAFSKHFVSFIRKITTDDSKSCIVFEKSNEKPIAFSCLPLTQYDGIGNMLIHDSISRAVEGFFAGRDLHDRLTQKSAATVKIINNNIDRCEKKIKIHTETLSKAKQKDRYKIFGDLLTANIYRLEQGMDKITVQNYYSENGEDIEISLIPELSPSRNAQRYYKLYSKAKVSEEHSSNQLEEALTEKAYLESVLDSIERATNYADISEIREELGEQGYISVQKSKKKQQKKALSPNKFISSDGYEILVGKNNKQNDELTIKMAYSTDIWFHTKNIPGSHTIVRTNGEAEVPDSTILEAANIAAYFSKARNSSGVPVDYTAVKNIKKPNGSKPGFVIYETNNTVYVTPDEKLVKSLENI